MHATVSALALLLLASAQFSCALELPKSYVRRGFLRGPSWNDDPLELENEGNEDRRRAATVFNEDFKLVASDSSPGLLFGAEVGISGTTVIVGVPFFDYGWRRDIGAVYVYDCSTQSSSCAVESDVLFASDRNALDTFGYDVAISGSMVVAGAPWNHGGRGSAYVFDCSTLSSCIQTDLLIPSDFVDIDPQRANYGWSVAISGRMVVVGTQLHQAAYVFDCSASPCYEISKLTPSDLTYGDRFGWSVAISGATVVIGNDPYLGTHQFSGRAYVFDCSTGSCNLTHKLTGPIRGDHFGYDVAVSGSMVVVGTTKYQDSTGAVTGAAYVFECTSASSPSCTEIKKLTASDGADGDIFGHKVAISGTTVAVGAAHKDGRTGAAYVFDCSTESCTETKLLASDGEENDSFGQSVDISGPVLVVGATGDDGASGSVYVFNINARDIHDSFMHYSNEIPNLSGDIEAILDPDSDVWDPDCDEGKLKQAIEKLAEVEMFISAAFGPAGNCNDLKNAMQKAWEASKKLTEADCDLTTSTLKQQLFDHSIDLVNSWISAAMKVADDGGPIKMSEVTKAQQFVADAESKAPPEFAKAMEDLKKASDKLKNSGMCP